MVSFDVSKEKLSIHIPVVRLAAALLTNLSCFNINYSDLGRTIGKTILLKVFSVLKQDGTVYVGLPFEF